MNKKYLYISLVIAVIVIAGAVLLTQNNNPSGIASAYFSTDTTGLPGAKPTEVVELNNGDTYKLIASPVKKNIGTDEVRMLAYNESVPGPVIKVKQGSEISLEFTNNTDVDATIHPHGVRVENAFDGVPDVTQKPVEIGDTFTYKLRFPDVGLYWYHPHLRQDYSQDLGLYGAFLVEPSDSNYWSPVNREEVLMVDDVLMESGKIAPYSTKKVDRVLMGRFGNTMLVNGTTDYSLNAKRGEVVRFYINNAANTRTFNLAIPNAKMKLVGADNGKYEKEKFVDSVMLAPSERSIVEVLFEQSGTYTLQHKTPDRTYTLGTATVADQAVAESYMKEFQTLRTNKDVSATIDPLRSLFTRAPDKRLSLTVETTQAMMSNNGGGGHMMPGGTMMGNDGSMMEPEKIEWEEQMAMMNEGATPDNTKWKIVDLDTNKANMDIKNWTFKVGDKVKVSIFNDPKSMHPMQHPIHFHGQRFLVLSTNGVPNTDLAWKDTVLVQTGDTVEVLVDMENPGTWMVHCHISEHPEAGMMFSFKVE